MPSPCMWVSCRVQVQHRLLVRELVAQFQEQWYHGEGEPHVQIGGLQLQYDANDFALVLKMGGRTMRGKEALLELQACMECDEDSGVGAPLETMELRECLPLLLRTALAPPHCPCLLLPWMCGAPVPPSHRHARHCLRTQKC